MIRFDRLALWLGRLRRDQQAAIAVETALASIILTILVMGGFEGARVVLLQQKLDRVSSTVADLVARKETLTTSDLADIYSAARNIMRPFDLNAQGSAYVSVVKPAAPPTITKPGFAWQRKLGGSATATSKLGAPGSDGKGIATLPAGFTLNSTEYVVVSEIYYAYSPIMAFDMFTAKLIYQASYSRPRLTEWPALN